MSSAYLYQIVDDGLDVGASYHIEFDYEAHDDVEAGSLMFCGFADPDDLDDNVDVLSAGPSQSFPVSAGEIGTKTFNLICTNADQSAIFLTNVLSVISQVDITRVSLKKNVSTGDSSTPLIPNRFRKMLWFAMAADDDIIQKSPKAKSYAAENRAKYQDTMEKMAHWDSEQYLN